MTAAEILETGAHNIILPTGAAWRRDGMGRTLRKSIPGYQLQNILSPDDLMSRNMESNGKPLEIRQPAAGLQNIVIYDDDDYYMGGVLAELLAVNGHNVSLVTSAPLVSYWSQFTLEQERIQSKLMKLGVRLFPQSVLSRIAK